MPPELRAVDALLSRVRRRLDLRAAAEGMAAGLALAALATLGGWPTRPLGAVFLGATFAVVGTLIRVFITRRRHASVPAYVERRVPTSRNIILTAHELGGATGEYSYVRALVLRRADEIARTVDSVTLVPTSAATIALVATLAVWFFAVTRAGAPVSIGTRALRIGASGPSIDGVDVVVTPPAYTGRQAQTLHDPTRVEALAGSRIAIVVNAHAQSVVLQTLASSDTLASTNGRFAANVLANADGFIALEPRLGGKSAGRRLIGLTVVPDAPPAVSIKTPGHDVRLADGHRTLNVAIESSDDIGLSSLRLHYTKVSGSGERFTFSEGDVPIAITRADARTWAAHASWKLDPLELGPGDMVVYRAIATDRRPGTAPTESDSYIAEVVSAGGEAAAGFAVDPEQDRYAVSQQMVILKTERLLARRPTMAKEDYGNEAQELAAEQRKVRAEFVFMLGGELADAPDVASSMTDLNEEAEAEGESDILAGRNANAGHIALLRAIRAMSRAAASLTTADLELALPQERAALTQLESAFSHTRILLRALSTRERLDLSRRLTGVLTDALREQRPIEQPVVDARVVELRRALADLASAAAPPKFADSSSAQLSAIAERVLRVDPSAKRLQGVAQSIGDASQSIARNPAQARAALDSAANGLVAVLRSGFIDAPVDQQSLDASQLAGALRDAMQANAPRGTPRP